MENIVRMDMKKWEETLKTIHYFTSTYYWGSGFNRKIQERNSQDAERMNNQSSGPITWKLPVKNKALTE